MVMTFPMRVRWPRRWQRICAGRSGFADFCADFAQMAGAEAPHAHGGDKERREAFIQKGRSAKLRRLLSRLSPGRQMAAPRQVWTNHLRLGPAPAVLMALAAVIAMISLSRRFSSSLAIAIMCGLLVATFLSLLYLRGLLHALSVQSFEQSCASEHPDLAPQHYSGLQLAFPLAEPAE